MRIMLFAVMWGILPSGGRGDTVAVLGVDVSFLTLDGLQHLLLPAINLGLFKLSLVIRLARAGTREVIHQDYIQFSQIGRASCRESVCQSVSISVVPVSLQKTNITF